jgi:hypothetical protein
LGSSEGEDEGDAKARGPQSRYTAAKTTLGAVFGIIWTSLDRCIDCYGFLIYPDSARHIRQHLVGQWWKQWYTTIIWGTELSAGSVSSSSSEA